jgi:hypothetical protein
LQDIQVAHRVQTRHADIERLYASVRANGIHKQPCASSHPNEKLASNPPQYATRSCGISLSLLLAERSGAALDSFVPYKDDVNNGEGEGNRQPPSRAG